MRLTLMVVLSERNYVVLSIFGVSNPIYNLKIQLCLSSAGKVAQEDLLKESRNLAIIELEILFHFRYKCDGQPILHPFESRCMEISRNV